MKENNVKNILKGKTDGYQQKLFPDKDNRLIEMKEDERKIYLNMTKNREFTIKL